MKYLVPLFFCLVLMPPVEAKVCLNPFKIIKKVIINIEIVILEGLPGTHYVVSALYDEKERMK